MAPVVTDLMSDSDSDESPEEALRNFKFKSAKITPRQSDLHNEDSEESHARVAQDALQGFQPRKEKVIAEEPQRDLTPPFGTFIPLPPSEEKVEPVRPQQRAQMPRMNGNVGVPAATSLADLHREPWPPAPTSNLPTSQIGSSGRDVERSIAQLLAIQPRPQEQPLQATYVRVDDDTRPTKRRRINDVTEPGSERRILQDNGQALDIRDGAAYHNGILPASANATSSDASGSAIVRRRSFEVDYAPSQSQDIQQQLEAEFQQSIRRNNGNDISQQHMPLTAEPVVQRTAVQSRSGVPWTPEEDALLKRLREVDKVPWSNMAAHFRGRTTFSLQTRYSSKVKARAKALDPNEHPRVTLQSQLPSAQVEETESLTVTLPLGQAIGTLQATPGRDARTYTSDEDALLLKLKDVERLPWPQIATHFPGRTASSLSAHYSTKLSRLSQPPKQSSETSGPRQLVERDEVSSKLPEPTQAPETNGVRAEQRSLPLTARAGNHGTPYTPEEDALLIQLKEVDNLSWPEIVSHFPTRTAGSVQVRYSTKLKTRPQLQRMASTQDDDQMTPDYQAPARRPARKRNNEAAGQNPFISWAEVKKQRLDESQATPREETVPSIGISQHRRQLERELAHRNSLSRILRRRELGANLTRSWSPSSSKIPSELKEHVFDDVGPRRYFKGTSGDVTCLAWAPDGNKFAAGSIALTDDRSMQYNKSCNLLIGDYERALLRELPEHHLPRPKVDAKSGNVNGLHSMRETQDPRLFMTVASVQFSPDSKTLYSAGSDCKVRAYEYNGDIDQASQLYEIEHPATLDLLTVSNANVLATACHQPADGSIAVFSGPTKMLSLSPSRQDRQTERAIYPSALKWGSAPQHTNYLLAGFSIDSFDEERSIAGETCLWNVHEDVRVPIHGVTRNVFDVAWNPSPSPASTVFAVASTPNHTIDKKTKSIVQCFAPNQNRATRVLEWECPAFDINDVVYCPHDNNLIAVGATDSKVYVWDQRFVKHSNKPLHMLSHSNSLSVLDHDRDREIADTGIRFLSWGATGSRLYSGSSDGVVKVWNPYRPSADAHVGDVASFTSAVMSGAFSPDYRELLIGEDQGRINLLSVGHADKSVRSMQRYELHSAPVPALPREDRLRPAWDLLASGQIEFRPMGTLPRRQAVQGPMYKGPYLAPSDQQVLDAETAYQQALDEQNDTHSRVTALGSQNSESERALRQADKLVEDAQAAMIHLQGKLDASAELIPAAEATQRAFGKKARASLSGNGEHCRLDCNYLPTELDDAGEVSDSRRWEARIPQGLRREPTADVWNMTVEDLAEAGLTSKCLTCFGPASKPKAGKLPLCESCDQSRNGLTGACELCSAPIRLTSDSSQEKLCERCSFACFRCSRPIFVGRGASSMTCDSCDLTWSAGVLGYELVEKADADDSAGEIEVRKTKRRTKRDGLVHQLESLELEQGASRWRVTH